MWKTLNPIWQTLILILLIAGAVPTIYFCGYKTSAKKAEAEKAKVIATYQASALVAEQLYTEKLKAANEEKQRWFDFAQAQSRDLATAYQQIGRQAAQLEKQIDETVQKDGNRFNGLGTNSVQLYNLFAGQFSGGAAFPNRVASSATATLPTPAAADLDYFVTYYDDAVFDHVGISATGLLTYTLKPGFVVSPRTYMNIVFQVKE